MSKWSLFQLPLDQAPNALSDMFLQHCDKLHGHKKTLGSLAYIEVYACYIPDGLFCGFRLMYLRAEEEDLRMVRMGLVYGDDCACNVHSNLVVTTHCKETAHLKDT